MIKLWDKRRFSASRKTGLNDLNDLNPCAQNSDPFGRVSDTLTKAVRPGDVVWDVGAGDGKFTELFCQSVGSGGIVVAFEPRALFREMIRERLPNCGWLQVERVTLAGFNAPNLPGAETSALSGDVVGATMTACMDTSEICRGDVMCNRLGRIPNVLKVAVQGFEEEMLAGMGTKLASATLRDVMVEVNFPRIGGEAGMAPQRMKGLLGAMGFKTNWVDEWHLFATRS